MKKGIIAVITVVLIIASVAALFFVPLPFFHLTADAVCAAFEGRNCTLYSIKEKADLSFRSGDLVMEDIDIADGTKKISMRIRKEGVSYGILYSIGSYSAGYLHEPDADTGFLSIAGQIEKYRIEGAPEGSIMLSDIALAEKIFSPDYGVVHIKAYYPAGSLSGGITEDVAVLTDSAFERVLFLDPETGLCSRLQAFGLKSGTYTEEYLIIREESTSSFFPEQVRQEKESDVMTGEEFKELSDKFILGALSLSFSETEQ